jgi:hypothetical protein
MDDWKKLLVHCNTSQQGTRNGSGKTSGRPGLAKERAHIPAALEQATAQTSRRINIAGDPDASRPSPASQAALALVEAPQTGLIQEELTKNELAILLRALESCGSRIHPSAVLRLRARLAGQ